MGSEMCIRDRYISVDFALHLFMSVVTLCVRTYIDRGKCSSIAKRGALQCCRIISAFCDVPDSDLPTTSWSLCVSVPACVRDTTDLKYIYDVIEFPIIMFVLQ